MNHSLHPRSGPLRFCRLLPRRLEVALEAYPENAARRDQKPAYRMINRVPYHPHSEWIGPPTCMTPSLQATATSQPPRILPIHPFWSFS